MWGHTISILCKCACHGRRDYCSLYSDVPIKDVIPKKYKDLELCVADVKIEETTLISQETCDHGIVWNCDHLTKFKYPPLNYLLNKNKLWPVHEEDRIKHQQFCTWVWFFKRVVGLQATKDVATYGLATIILPFLWSVSQVLVVMINDKYEGLFNLSLFLHSPSESKRAILKILASKSITEMKAWCSHNDIKVKGQTREKYINVIMNEVDQLFASLS